MRSRLAFSICLVLFSATACSGEANNDTDTKGTPLSCSASSECPDGQDCASLETAEGDTEKICVEQTACGTRSCASGRCGSSPASDDPRCIVDDDATNNDNDDPCAELACGARCSTCDASNNLSCPAVEEYCQPDGSCDTNAAPMCDPCADKACGDRCSTCTEETCPAVEEYCQADGSCATDALPMCEYDSCGGKMCGDPCTICDPTDPDCVETTVEKFCDDAGACIAGAATC